jgi:hypothetical protein
VIHFGGFLPNIVLNVFDGGKKNVGGGGAMSDFCASGPLGFLMLCPILRNCLA